MESEIPGVSGSSVAGDLLEKLLVVVALFSFTGAVFPLLYTSGAQEDVEFGHDGISPALHAASYVLAVFFAWRNGKLSWASLAPPKSIIALLLLALASTAWSIDPGVSGRAFVLLVAGTCFATYFARRFTMREQLDLLAITLGIVVVLSPLVVLFAPRYGIEPGVHAGDWRGVYVRKNSFGAHVALAAAVFMCWSYRRGPLAVFGWILAAASTWLAVMSDSATAIGTCGLCFAGIGIIRLVAIQRFPLKVLLLLLVAIAAALTIIGVQNPASLLTVLGRDDTLSGRTVLWGLVYERILDRPWFGYGVQAFWLGKPQLYAAIWKAVGWAPPHAHNGFLDLALDLGLLGVVVFAISYVHECRKAIVNLRRYGLSYETLWPSLFLLLFLLSNLTESRILRHTSILWLLYVAAVTTSEDLQRLTEPLRRRLGAGVVATPAGPDFSRAK